MNEFEYYILTILAFEKLSVYCQLTTANQERVVNHNSNLLRNSGSGKYC